MSVKAVDSILSTADIMCTDYDVNVRRSLSNSLPKLGKLLDSDLMDLSTREFTLHVNFTLYLRFLLFFLKNVQIEGVSVDEKQHNFDEDLVALDMMSDLLKGNSKLLLLADKKACLNPTNKIIEKVS